MSKSKNPHLIFVDPSYVEANLVDDSPDSFDKVDSRESLKLLLAKTSTLHVQVLSLRSQGFSFQEVSERLQISVSMAFRLLREAVEIGNRLGLF